MNGGERDALTGLRAIADLHDGFIFDVWGTVYDGGQVFPNVVKVFEGLRRLEKRIVFLSNSPQLPSIVGERLARIGLEADFHDGIVTSGGETHFQLSAGTLPELAPFKGPVYLTGPDRFPDTLPPGHAGIVKSVSEADWVLNAGPNHPPETLDDYEERLQEGVARGLPMLCANPDKTVPQGGDRLICAGALAERYSALGGSVVHIGKPHDLVFRRCAEILGITDRQRILMVGDNLETDILGANSIGYRSLLVASGVHGLLDGKENIAFSKLETMESTFGARPDHVIDALKW
jgi:HAD superfamily hydrolase (TIGR01459 family)